MAYINCLGKDCEQPFEYVNKGDEVAILGKLVHTYKDSDDKTQLLRDTN